tara:strand:- start:161 stop:832 length:672 start_codon:yes stop_codon:yes gene_type:complete
MTSFLEKAYRIDRELGEWIEYFSALEFDFNPDNIYAYNSNYEYFWYLESKACDHPEIDLAFRCGTVEYIRSLWRVRLKGYAPYRTTGYFLYMWESLAPKMEIMAFKPELLHFEPREVVVDSIEEMMRPYVDRPWDGLFDWSRPRPGPKDILHVIEKEKGSIGSRTAQRLGFKVGELRRDIGRWEIEGQVNCIRKKYHRRPAKFVNHYEAEWRRHYYEIWPAKY